MRTPTLPELQATFWRSLAPGREPDPRLSAVVRGTRDLSPHDRLAIYAGMYVSRIVEALAGDFPKVAAFVGSEAFAALVRDYIASHPSTEPSIRHVGSALPTFVAECEPAWLGDLARLEWARLEVFDAPDAEPLTVADLRGVPAGDWPELRLALVPACTRLVTGWPVHRLWTDAPLPDVPARTALRVWRHGFAVYQTVMDEREEGALERVAAGQPFAFVCEGLDDGAEAAALLLRWVEDGIIAAPSTGAADPPAGAPA